MSEVPNKVTLGGVVVNPDGLELYEMFNIRIRRTLTNLTSPNHEELQRFRCKLLEHLSISREDPQRDDRSSISSTSSLFEHQLCDSCKAKFAEGKIHSESSEREDDTDSDDIDLTDSDLSTMLSSDGSDYESASNSSELDMSCDSENSNSSNYDCDCSACSSFSTTDCYSSNDEYDSSFESYETQYSDS